MKTDNTQAIAKNLFARISDFITKSLFENNWIDAQGKFLSLVNLSTNERWAKYEPWNDIFYLRFFYGGGEEEKPVIVGLGSFAANQVTVDSSFVTEEIRKLFNKFGFGVIAPIHPHMTFEQMKKEVLPYYLEMEKYKKTKQTT